MFVVLVEEGYQSWCKLTLSQFLKSDWDDHLNAL